jgi:uncharacterized protein with FMN-binding domain
MRKTLIILSVSALLGILAAYELPAPGSTTAKVSTPSQSTTSKTSSGSGAAANTSSSPGQYKDGTYMGAVFSNQYDNIQVSVTIQQGKIASIATPELSGVNSHSDAINSFAIPQLKTQTFSAQSSSIDGVSGASYTSQSYDQSLQSALDQAATT